jgi:hypothetical protein
MRILRQSRAGFSFLAAGNQKTIKKERTSQRSEANLPRIPQEKPDEVAVK